MREINFFAPAALRRAAEQACGDRPTVRPGLRKGRGAETKNDEKKMKAAIIGYGKMGREIETILRERGHEVALIIDMDNAAELDAAHLQGIDVALEFTTPATAYRNIRTCIECGTPVVSGTTGWTDRLPELQALCREREAQVINRLAVDQQHRHGWASKIWPNLLGEIGIYRVSSPGLQDHQVAV